MDEMAEHNWTERRLRCVERGREGGRELLWWYLAMSRKTSRRDGGLIMKGDRALDTPFAFSWRICKGQ